MKWAYHIKNKLTIAALLAVVFIAVFVKNLVDEEYVSDLTSSFSTFYEDRLLPESYIFHLSENLYQKKIMISQCNDPEDYAKVEAIIEAQNEVIDSIMVDFESTVLTKSEAVYLAELRKNTEEIRKMEEDFKNPSITNVDFQTTKAEVDQLLVQASKELNQLSEIQLTVGKQLNDRSKKIRAGSSILTRFEMALLIVLGLVINGLIFTSSSMKSKIRQSPHLN